MKKAFIAAGVSIVLTGCATTGGHQQHMVEQLQMRVGDLEQQLASKNQQVQNLEYQVKDLSYEVEKVQGKLRASQPTAAQAGSATAIAPSSAEDTRIIRVEASEQEVQKALQSAGFYSGTIDGKVGDQTKTAIAAFQKSKGLSSDGIVGQKTWSALKEYLR